MYASGLRLKTLKMIVLWHAIFLVFLSTSSSSSSSSSFDFDVFTFSEDNSKKNWLKFFFNHEWKKRKWNWDNWCQKLLTWGYWFLVCYIIWIFLLYLILLCVVFVMLLDVCRTCSSFCQSLEAVMLQEIESNKCKTF